MNSNSYFITFFFIVISFFTFSQHKYSFEVESLNNKAPQEVLEDFSQYLEDYNKEFVEGVFFFESKIVYTEENFKEVAAATGYTIKDFKITSRREAEQNIEE
ncbi:MAG TPA: hypothetical protein VFD77_00370 [Brumimicrobium sp.]|nr:hypothetical protein [Brumimicrobium sp.]